MARILVVEDEPVIRTELRRLLVKRGHQISEAASVSEALEHGPATFELIISDLRLPGAQGTEIIASADGVPVIIMTSFATVHSAVDAMKQGAVDYISKPFDPDELILVVERVLRESNLTRANRALKKDLAQSWSVDGLVAQSQAMKEVLERVARVAPTDSTVLILGESGTGKELIARAIHAKSPRIDAAFVAVNCAAIPEGLIESELFGHEKGAFTGAVARQPGLVESASGGTLFLDEIGELPPAAQARLLRLLQESEIRAVGAQRSRKVDVRVISATHRDLPDKVRLGEFREDLYFRLRVVDIQLPPLRQRTEEIPALALFLLEKVSRKLGRTGLSLTPAAQAALLRHTWPGNVRELENALERAVILSPQPAIEPGYLGLLPAARPPTQAPTEPQSPADEIDEASDGEPVFHGALADYFRWFVETHQHELSETELAKRLGISRKTLWERRQKLGLPRNK